MITDFRDSFERHSKDAQTLFSLSRWANADHLFGLATECGLKQLIFGMLWDSSHDKPKERDDRVHADKAWDRYEYYRSGPEAAGYVLSTPNPYSDWDASQRYAAQAEFDQARVEPHKTACEEVRELLKKALLDGEIS
jgi:hypothetical protein